MEEKQGTRLGGHETRGFVLFRSVTVKNLGDQNPSESIRIHISYHVLTVTLNSQKTTPPDNPPLSNTIFDFDAFKYIKLFR